MPGSWTYITVKFIPFNTQSKHQGSFSGKLISSQSLSSCLHQGWAQSSWEGAFQPRQANWSSLFWVGRAASGGSTTSGKKGRGSFKDGRTTEELSNVGVWVGVWNLDWGEERTDGVANRSLQRSVLFGLAADVVEGEHEVVIVSQIGRNLHLHLFVKLRGPFEKESWTRNLEKHKGG